jgi:hypothetical protein
VRTVRSRTGKSRGYATAWRFDGRSRSEGGDEGTGHSRCESRAAVRAKAGEAEVTEVFEKVINARVQSSEAREVADRHFFETVIRIHRAGEGAPFTGLKPAGLGHGPVDPVAEKAVETGSP